MQAKQQLTKDWDYSNLEIEVAWSKVRLERGKPWPHDLTLASVDRTREGWVVRYVS